MNEPWPRFETGDLVQAVDDPTRFGVVVEGLRQVLSGGLFGYVPTPESLARYGYVLRVKWGLDAFEADVMDTKQRTRAVHIRKIQAATPDVAALISQMTTDRMFALRLATRWPVTAYHALQAKPMTEGLALGWFHQVSSDGWGTFEITAAGRAIEERFRTASLGVD